MILPQRQRAFSTCRFSGNAMTKFDLLTLLEAKDAAHKRYLAAVKYAGETGLTNADRLDLDITEQVSLVAFGTAKDAYVAAIKAFVKG